MAQALLSPGAPAAWRNILAAAQDDGLLDALPVGLYLLDRERRIVFWNRAAEQLTGYDRRDVVGRCCRDGILVHCDAAGTELCHGACPAQAAIEDGRPRCADVFMKHAKGHRVPIQVRVSPIRGEGEEIAGAVETFLENSSKWNAVAEAREYRQLAMLDTLTGAGNRRLAEQQLDLAAYQLAAHGRPFGVIFLDVDRFKQVNDRYGHACGDAVLELLANTLRGSVRESDCVCRYGGDEFLVVAGGAVLSDLAAAAGRCRALIEASRIDWEGTPVAVTVSAGCAEARPGENVKELLRRADLALYNSKCRGRNQVST